MEDIMVHVNENNRKTNNKYKNRKYLYFGIVALFLLVGISYAIIFFMERYESSPLGMQTDLLDVTITENGLVAMENAITQKDSEGLGNDKTTFTIANNNDVPIRVIIKLVEDHNSTIDINNIRFGILNNGGIVNLGNLGENDGVLLDFFMNPGQGLTLQSTIWLDYFYEGGDTDEVFSGKYVVEASNANQFGYMYLSNLIDKNKGLYPINADGTLNESNSIVNEYRYSGLDPDNYVYFNNELWRIVGLFDGKIKIVRDDEILKSEYTDNDTYYESLDDEFKEYVAEVEFNTGDVNLTDTYTSLLTNEKSVKTEGYINYISASDYLYSTDPNYYTSPLNSTDVSSNTWLTGTYLTSSGISGSENVLGINENIPTSATTTDETYNIKPCLYLKNTVSVVGGYGTKDKPYELDYIEIIEIDQNAVSYDLNGGSGYIQPTCLECKITLGIPTRDGYKFIGWATSSTATSPEYLSGDTYNDEESITLYAVWEEVELYTVTLSAGAVESVGTEKIYNIENEGIYLNNDYVQQMSTTRYPITIPVKSGYSFDGYYTSENGQGTKLISEDGYITTAFTDNLLNSNTTLYAHWTSIAYMVSYNGNRFVTPVTQTLEGVSVTYDPTASTLTLNGKPTASLIFGYIDETFTVDMKYITTLNYISGMFTKEGSTTFSTEVTDSSRKILSTRNYAIAALPTSGDDTTSSTLEVTSNDVSNGKFLRIYIYFDDPSSVTFTNYKIKVNITKEDVKNVVYGQPYGTLGATPLRAGYDFGGWYTAESGGTQITSSTNVTTAKDHTLYAHWNLRNFNLYLNANGGTIPTTTGWTKYTSFTGMSMAYKTTSFTSTYGTLPTPTRSGYTFNGWSNVLKTISSLSLTAGDSKYKFGNIYTEVVPGATYTITMSSAQITTGSSTKFSIVAYDFTDSVNLAQEDVDFGDNLTYTITVPSTANRTNELRILLYAGVAGSTTNNVVTFTNIKISSTDSTALTTYTASSIVNVPHEHELIAGWTVNQTCSWEQTSQTTVYGTCSSVSKPSNPVAGNTYAECTNTRWRYVRGAITCGNGTTLSSSTSEYTYTSSSLAGTYCQSNYQNAIAGCASNGGATGGVNCSTSSRSTRTVYTYTCS